MNECKFCEGVADFIWLDDNGQWYVCGECIKDGETDAKAEGDDDDGQVIKIVQCPRCGDSILKEEVGKGACSCE